MLPNSTQGYTIQIHLDFLLTDQENPQTLCTSYYLFVFALRIIFSMYKTVLFMSQELYKVLNTTSQPAQI